MAMSEDKNPPLSEEVEFDAVDLEKQPKRVRKAEAKPPTILKGLKRRIRGKGIFPGNLLLIRK